MIFFCCILGKLLFTFKKIDLLWACAWLSFLLVLPLSAFISLTRLEEPLVLFANRVIVFSGILLGLQLFRRTVVYLPKCLRRFFQYLGATVDDFFAFITYFILFRSECHKRTSSENMGTGSVPILMIHGYNHDSGAWYLHRQALADAGFGPVFVIDLGSASHSIEEYAQRVQIKAHKIAEMTGTKDLILIGFSMGGVVASYYALHLAAKEPIKGVITLGSPLEGTKMALFGRGQCAKQMHYGSEFMRTLKAKILANQTIPFWHIGSWADPAIRPPESAWVEGGRSRQIVIDDMGHLAMLYSNSIYRQLQACLTTFTPYTR